LSGRDVLVFDLDGTLIDSAPDLLAALNRVLEEEGCPPVTLEDVKMMVGDGAAKLVERGFAKGGAWLDGPDLARLTERYVCYYEAIVADLTRPFPGVPETLERLADAGYRLGVCTNKPEGPAREVLQALGLLRHFKAIHGGDSGPAKKPDPEPLRAVLRELDGAPESGVMVGDSPVDVATARAAGVPVIVVPHGYSRVSTDELRADAVLAEFAELPELLKHPPFA